MSAVPEPLIPHSSDIEWVRSVSPFRRAGGADLDRLFAEARVFELGKRQTVFVAGHPARSLFLLLRGQIKVFTASSRGRESTLRVLQGGPHLVFPAVPGQRIYTVSCETVRPSRLLAFPLERIGESLMNSPHLAEDLIAELAGIHDEVGRHLADLKGRTSLQRLAGFLSSLTSVTKGAAVVHLPVSKMVLASMIGVVPEKLSRDFAKLAEFGVITKRSTVSIRDVRKLREIYIG